MAIMDSQVHAYEANSPKRPWADLPKVLDLAMRPNAVIKVSGACANVYGWSPVKVQASHH